MLLKSGGTSRGRYLPTLLLVVALLVAPSIFPGGGGAWAQDECGAAPATGGTITCDKNSYEPSTEGNIYYLLTEDADYTFTLTDQLVGDAGIVINAGDKHHIPRKPSAVWIQHVGNGDLSVVSNAEVTTSGDRDDRERGIMAVVEGYSEIPRSTYRTLSLEVTNSTLNTAARAIGAVHCCIGPMHVHVKDVSIRTTATSGIGIVGWHDALGAVNINAVDSRIETEGTGSYGVFARMNNLNKYETEEPADINVTLTNMSIETASERGFGLYADHHGPGTIGLDLVGGSINTAGDDGYGVFARHRGTGDVFIDTDGANISTEGANSHGVVAQILDAASQGNIDIDVTSGRIETANAHGILAENAGTGSNTINVYAGAEVIAGAEGHGIDASGIANHLKIAGRVSGGSGAGAGVHLGHGGTIEVTESGRVDAVSNIAFRNDAGNMDVIIKSDDLTYLHGQQVHGAAEGLTDVTVQGTNLLDDNEVPGSIPRGIYDLGLLALDDVVNGWRFGDVVAPRGAVYEVLPRVLLGLQQSGPPSWRRRTGGVFPSVTEDGPGSVWFSVEAANASYVSASSTVGAKFDYDRQGLWGGIDVPIPVGKAASRQLGLGLGGHHVRGSASVSSRAGGGSIDATGTGMFGTASWLDAERQVYIDARMAATWYEADLSSSRNGLLKDDARGFGWSAALETGQRFQLGASSLWSMTPRVELARSSVDLDAFSDVVGSRVSIKDGDSLRGKFGADVRYGLPPGRSATGQGRGAVFFAAADLTYEFHDQTRVVVTGLDVVSRTPPTWGWLTAGGTYGWPGCGTTELRLVGEVRYGAPLGGSGGGHEVSGNIGIRWVL